MGSCFSKTMEEKMKKKTSSESRDPPAPESPQEEKVKEVLSETPKPRASTRAREELFKKEEKEVGIKKMKLEPDEASVSDLYSESFSASSTQKMTTTTKAAAAAEEVEQKRRVARSPSKKRSFSGELQPARKDRGGVGVGCRSGSRSSPSPPTRRTISAADAAKHRHAAAQCEKFRRDHSNDKITKRSVSPTAKRAIELRRGQHCRSLSASRASGRCSPQRVPLAPSDAAAAEEESLENPLVSLECFIFL